MSRRQGEESLFVDPEFPPTFESIFPDGVVPPNHQDIASMVYWKRASELSVKPCFVLDGFQRHDVDQGVLGDCWFLSSAAILATGHPNLFQKVVYPNQGFESHRYTGQFIFSFWCYGDWVEVVVDDYLPVIRRGELVFASNRENPNEYWPCLLEKAYAKLHGGYMKLEGGRADHAVVMLTGGIPEDFDLRKNAQVPHNMYSLLVKSYRMKSLMLGAVYEGQKVIADTGLEKNHEYCITGFVEVGSGQGKQRLLRILNPWGNTEWRGAWSDSSPEMASLSADKRREMMFVKKDDGEFWMKFEDFRYYFDNLTLCHLQPDSLISELEDNDAIQSWQVTSHHGEWRAGQTAGGATNNSQFWSNPQIQFTVTGSDNVTESLCTVIISLMEKDIGLYFKERRAVGFDLYQVRRNQGRLLSASGQGSEWTLLWQCLLLTQGAQITKRFELQRGTYTVVPYTYKPNEQSRFMMRLFSVKPIESQMLSGRAPGNTMSTVQTIPARLPSSSLPNSTTTSTAHRTRGNSMSSNVSEVFHPGNPQDSPIYSHPKDVPPTTTFHRRQNPPSVTFPGSRSAYGSMSRFPVTAQVVSPFPVTAQDAPPFPVTNQDAPPFPVTAQDAPPFPVTAEDIAPQTLVAQDGSPFPRSQNYFGSHGNRLVLNQKDIYAQPRRDGNNASVSIHQNAIAAASFQEQRMAVEERRTHTEKRTVSRHQSHQEERTQHSSLKPSGVSNSALSTTVSPNPSKQSALSTTSTNVTHHPSNHTGSHSTYIESYTGPTPAIHIDGIPVSPPSKGFSTTFEKHAQGGNSLDVHGLSAFLEDISGEEWTKPLKFSPETCRSLVFRADKDGSGRLDDLEVRSIWNEIKAYRDLFHQFAPDPNRLVDANYLGYMFEKLGFPVAKSIERDIVRRFGSGPANSLNVQDFILILIKLTSLFEAFDEKRLQNHGAVADGEASFSRDEFLRASMFT